MTLEQMEILTRALGILISLVITFIVKPLIDSKISATKQEELKKYIEIAVRCAEQIYTPEEWLQKKQYVYKYVKDILEEKLNLKLTEEEINLLIEGVVFEIKRY